MKENFIEQSNKIHNYKYDYSLVNYINARTKVKIICPEHGVFEQTPDNHKNKKQGCPKCSGKNKKTNEEIINIFKNIHGNKYNYSLVNYINARTKVKIICPEHGVFEQRVDHHINGIGCLRCFNKHKKTTTEFIKKSKEIHGNKYNYSLVDYKNNRTKVKIICPEHGIFEQTSINHINRKQGCPMCVGKYKNTNIFIKESKKINGDKYDYSLVDYKNNRTKVKIICPEHGVFEQTPNNHLTKNQGCPICSESHGEKEISKILDELNIKYIKQYKFDDCKDKNSLPFDFYLPEHNMCIEFDGEQHFRPIEYWGGDEKFNNIKRHDNIKNDYCIKENIELIRIKYDNIFIKQFWELFVYK